MYGPGANYNSPRCPVTRYSARAPTHRPTCVYVYSYSTEVDGVAEQDRRVLVCDGCVSVYVWVCKDK